MVALDSCRLPAFAKGTIQKQKMAHLLRHLCTAPGVSGEWILVHNFDFTEYFN